MGPSGKLDLSPFPAACPRRTSFSRGPTGGGETAAQPAEGPWPADVERWLEAELPESPTVFRTRPRRRPWIKRPHVLVGAGLGGVLLLVLLGVVLKVRTTDGTLVITVSQPGAEVSVDDGKVTITSPGDSQPVEVQIAEGKHVLRVTKGGFETFTKEFTIRSGGKETVRVELVREKPAIAAEPPKPAAPIAAAPPAAPSVAVTAASKEPLQLLPLIDPEKDAVCGSWKLTPQGVAVEQANGATALQLPYEPPEEYDFEIEFTPPGGGLNVNQYVCAAGYSFAWKLNSHAAAPPLYGFELLDGKFACDFPEAAVRKPMPIESGKRYTSRIEVRRGSLRTLVNGEEYVKWSGDFTRFSMEAISRLKNDRCLGIGAYHRAVVFHRVEVREVTGKGKSTRAATRVDSPPPAGPIAIGEPSERPKPISVNIKPEPLELKPGEPLSRLTLVANPPPLAGVRSWTIEPLGHRGFLSSLAYSPDGRLLASGARSGNILLWDAATETLLRTLVGHGSWVTSITFSPDGRYIASAGGNDGTLRFWDANSGLVLRTYRLDGSPPVESVAWSPDGRAVLAGTYWGGAPGIWVYSMESGGPPRKVGEAKNVFCLSWAPNGRVFASAGSGQQVLIWGFPSLTLQQRIEVGAESPRESLAWSPDGRLLATLAGKTLRVWDAASGQPWRPLPSAGDPWLYQAAWSPEGKTLAVAFGLSTVRRWDLKTQTVVSTPGLPVRTPAVPRNVATPVLAYAPHGATLAAGDTNGAIHLYQDRTGWRTLAAHNEAVVASAFSPDGKTLAYLKGDGTVRLWQVDSDQPPHQFGQNPTSVGSGNLTWSADGRILAAAVNGSEVFVWNTASGKRLGQFPAPSVQPRTGSSSMLSPDGKSLAANVGKVRLYQVPSGRLAWEAEVGGKGVAWSPDGKSLAAGAGNDVVILNPQGGKTLKTLSGSSNPVSFIAWSRDGKSVAAKAVAEHQVCIWESASGRLVRELTDDVLMHASALDWLPDGKTLVCGGESDTSLCDVESGKLLRQYAAGNQDSGQSVSLDGRYFACVMDGTIRVCSLADGRVLRTLLSLRGGQDAFISPDGHYSGPPGIEKRIVYVVQTDAGQETLTAGEFVKRYGWKNDPQKAVGPLPP